MGFFRVCGLISPEIASFWVWKIEAAPVGCPKSGCFCRGLKETMLPPPENTDSGIVQEAESLMAVAFDTMAIGD